MGASWRSSGRTPAVEIERSVGAHQVERPEGVLTVSLAVSPASCSGIGLQQPGAAHTNTPSYYTNCLLQYQTGMHTAGMHSSLPAAAAIRVAPHP